MESLKMIENRIRLTNSPGFMRDIPGRKRATRLGENMDLIVENVRPRIKIFLVPEFSVLQPRITPFDTPVLPPSKHPQSGLCSTEGHELHTKSSKPEKVGIFGSEGVFGQQDVFSGYLEFVDLGGRPRCSRAAQGIDDASRRLPGPRCPLEVSL